MNNCFLCGCVSANTLIDLSTDLQQMGILQKIPGIAQTSFYICRDCNLQYTDSELLRKFLSYCSEVHKIDSCLIIE